LISFYIAVIIVQTNNLFQLIDSVRQFVVV